MKFTYLEVSDMIKNYLEQYPQVQVALECVREDVEGDGEIANKVIEAIAKLERGEKDFEVLKAWGIEVGSRDLQELAAEIEKAHSLGKDIGYFVKKINPEKSHYSNKKDRPYKKRKNY